MTRSALILVTVSLLAACATSPVPAEAASTCPGRNGAIAVGAAHGIDLVTSSRKVRSTLAEKPRAGDRYTNFDPSVSCDGRWIVYVNFPEADCDNLEVIDVRRRRRRLYTSGQGYRTTGFPARHRCPGDPAFLDDGRIVFSSSRGGPSGTYVVDLDGSRMRRLFGAQEQAATSDGRWFVNSDPASHKLYLLDADGRRVRALTKRGAGNGREYLNPSISPNGRWIAYEKVTFAAAGRKGKCELFVVRRDARQRRLLASAASRFEPTFSPDGRRIAFTRRPGRASGGNVFELPLAHPGRARALTRISGPGVTSPAWGAR